MIGPASGYRYLDGKFRLVAEAIYSWSTSCYSKEDYNSGYMDIKVAEINTIVSATRPHAFPVRCVQKLN